MVCKRNNHTNSKKQARCLSLNALVLFLIFFISGCYQTFQKLPEGLDTATPERPVPKAELVVDLTWVDDEGRRHTEQEIFEQVHKMIYRAEEFILIDMFLFNNFGFAANEDLEPLADKLTAHLVMRKKARPELTIIFISDPINTVYGGTRSEHFDRLREAGVTVIETNLHALPDSNPLYSWFWRLFLQPWGTGYGETVPNPFDEGRVGLRGLLRLFNFKANHRKVVVADDGLGEHLALVTSANPHSASSAHWNAGVYFSGKAVMDLIMTEQAVLNFSDGPALSLPDTAAETLPEEVGESTLTARILTENAIKKQLLTLLDAAGSGSRIDLIMFYFSDRDIVKACKLAASRGADIRVILDPNKDAFGRSKSGVPNRQVGRELHKAGIPVRWADTHGEQCHTKLIYVQRPDTSACLLTGSANYTRRNLDNYNLETVVMIEGDSEAELFVDTCSLFNLLWYNTPDRRFTVDYEKYKNHNPLRILQYHFQEWSGLSTF